jgi:hypothetical protein
MTTKDMKQRIIAYLKKYNNEFHPAKIGQITFAVYGEQFAVDKKNESFYNAQVFSCLLELKEEGKVKSVNCPPTEETDALIKECQWLLT